MTNITITRLDDPVGVYRSDAKWQVECQTTLAWWRAVDMLQLSYPSGVNKVPYKRVAIAHPWYYYRKAMDSGGIKDIIILTTDEQVSYINLIQASLRE